MTQKLILASTVDGGQYVSLLGCTQLATSNIKVGRCLACFQFAVIVGTRVYRLPPPTFLALRPMRCSVKHLMKG